MGLMIHTLGELPANAERGYYIYLLDYGWKEPLANALQENFHNMADMASRHDAVVIRGLVGSHFDDEVLSWHHVNGQPGDEILPAILITTRHPRDFHAYDWSDRKATKEYEDRMLLIPLRKACTTSTEVVNLVNKIFSDIKDQKALRDFTVTQEMKRGQRGAVVDALILEPNIGGVGINLNYIINFLLGRKQT
ncbi:MAG: hypothetical protein BWY63_01780 [Chloroflexi bacterium ADurb.Bin360]|nr:MAG: hypothetical protein BWY63_01780 [Chloroflexi bacterium ADurb.Bin360]